MLKDIWGMSLFEANAVANLVQFPAEATEILARAASRYGMVRGPGPGQSCRRVICYDM